MDQEQKDILAETKENEDARLKFVIANIGWLYYNETAELREYSKKRVNCKVCGGGKILPSGPCGYCDGTGKRPAVHSFVDLQLLEEKIKERKEVQAGVI